MTSTAPRWMQVLALLIFFTLVTNALRDVFYAPAREVEVWFGFELTGPWALLTAPIHWAILAIGAWGFWTAQPWIAPAAAGYLFYAAFSHLVWSEVSPNGRGWRIGLVQALAISTAAIVILRLSSRVASRRPQEAPPL
jgi:hypothetical protein